LGNFSGFHPHPIFNFSKIRKLKGTPKQPNRQKGQNRVFRFWGTYRTPKIKITQMAKIAKTGKS